MLIELYKLIYIQGCRLPKRDRFGINSKLENHLIEAWELAVAAALENKSLKLPHLNKLRIKIEIIKRLVRLEKELNIVDLRLYIDLSQKLQEVSKMTNGWIKFIQQGGAKAPPL